MLTPVKFSIEMYEHMNLEKEYMKNIPKYEKEKYHSMAYIARIFCIRSDNYELIDAIMDYLWVCVKSE